MHPILALTLLGGGVAAAGYLVAAAAAARALTRARRRLPEVEPAAFDIAAEDIWLRARGDGLHIAAWHMPAPRATRAVIVAHGVGGCRGRELLGGSLGLARDLVASGFSVLMIDLRGHGESDPAPLTYGIRERRDVLGAVDWLLGRGYAPGSIGVLGVSMGGVAGIAAAGEEPAIGALVIDSACADFAPLMREHFRRFSKLPAALLPGAALIGRLMVGENLARLRPAAMLAAIQPRPAMVIHAQGDRLVPADHARALAAAGAELWLTPAQHHRGSYAADPTTYARRVIACFEAALVPRPAQPRLEAAVAVPPRPVAA